MSIRDEKEYARQRESAEREAAGRATDVTARDAHLALADRYADRISMLEERHFPDSPKVALNLRYARS